MKNSVVSLCLLTNFLISNQSQAQTSTPPKPAATGGTVTTRESTTTGSANTVPLVVAVLALVSAAASLTISSISAFRLKDKEYKNDYYKKVIDKRIKAVEEVERILADFTLVPNVESMVEGKHFSGPCYGYFFNNVDELTAENIIIPFNKELTFLFWCSKATSMAVSDLYGKITEVVGIVTGLTLLPGNRIVLYAMKHDEVKEKVNAIEQSIIKDMEKLYDVEAFFKDKAD